MNPQPTPRRNRSDTPGDDTSAVSSGTMPGRHSAFTALGFRGTLADLRQEIRALYAADEVPWIVGYSGGKDSTATL